MAVSLKRLISQVTHMDVRLLAGEKGLENLVHWVHMVETIEACDFLEGKEIAFTTGIGLNTGTTLLGLAKRLHKYNASGLVVNIGPFIEAVDSDVLTYCNEHDFPVFTVPWRIHLAEMIRIFSFSITKSDQKELELTSAFKNAIFFPKQDELYMTPLLKNDLQADWTYCAAVLTVQGIEQNMEYRLNKMHQAISNFICHHFKNCISFLYEGSILLVFANYDENMLHQTMDEIKKFISRIICLKESICYGVGKCTKSIRCLYKSYKQAISVQKLQVKGKIDRNMIYYTEMGIYKLLMGIDDKEILDDHYEQTILPLTKYDQEHHSDLTAVLSCYLKHNGSVKETAAVLYTHRNSVNYKLRKISELLQMDLSTLHTRMILEIGFMLQDITL